MKVYEEVEKHVLKFGTGWRWAATFPSEKDLLLSVEQETGWATELDLESFLTVSRIETRFIGFPNGSPVSERPCCYNMRSLGTCSVLALFNN